ncbi:MAG: secretin and TonB N-terminal domain-containing protein [Duncaniella sp.]|nr:secretin and TonB N-terminal domain-containing protein [Duncaniella sp.]
MKRLYLILMAAIFTFIATYGRNVTVSATDRPAAEVFRAIVEQTGMNFIYSSELLDDMRVTVHVTDVPLRDALAEIFKGTDVKYSIKGKNIVLKRRRATAKLTGRNTASTSPRPGVMPSIDNPEMLDEVVVVSRLEAPAVETAEVGARKLTPDDINATPVLLGESDVLKSLQMEPGVSGSAEGMAGMHVHGGNADENLFMIDNVPVYQANHFAGLFSAFNVDAIRYIDFFKSSVPAKYDGRLSSYLDVRTKDGSPEGHHGSARLGLTSGAFHIGGPIGHKTTYLVALRRSWFDLVSIPALMLVNSDSDEKIRFRYAFMDLNGKVTHRFNSRARGFVSVYFGNDILRTGSRDKNVSPQGWYENDRFDLDWGNIVAQGGFNYRLRDDMSAEFTAAYTRFFSGMKHDYLTAHDYSESRAVTRTDNNIDDLIFRADFDWRPDTANRVRYGAGYTLHSFLPARTSRNYSTESAAIATRDSTWSYTASEANMYIEDEWTAGSHIKLNAGLHGSLFSISGKTHFGLSPRLSASYRPVDNMALKAAYSHTTQYVHQLSQTYLSLPTDQWVPITGKFKPQTADKISAGAYFSTPDGVYQLAAEGYMKFMRNLVDYRDEYYLYPPTGMWTSRLCSGRGTAKGVDLKIEKTSGKFTGHIAYSLAWADRTFADKNGGRTFPARFDHRHTVNILLNWKVSGKVQLNAAWTGHSGSRFTFMPQVWDSPEIDVDGFQDDSPLRTTVNNYQLPLYHRLDLSCTVKNRRGYWNFGLYNAYCHLNTVAICRDITDEGKPVFKKVKMLPLIPSISYTWLF